MKQAGQVVLFRFPHTDLGEEKLRPALLLKHLPGKFDDWLICMISSQTHHFVYGFDEMLQKTDVDFSESGLKLASVIRVGRLAVVEEGVLLGLLGEISSERLERIRRRLAAWLSSS